MNWIDKREDRKTTFWDSPQEQYDDNIETSVRSMQAYATGKKVALTYSGGKDSSATLSLVLWMIETGQLEVEDLIVLYADTGLELPPLAITAMATIKELNKRGYKTRIVRASVENRLYVKMLGYGYPYPTNRRRWCTRLLKQDPMSEAIHQMWDAKVYPGDLKGDEPHADELHPFTVVKDGKILFTQPILPNFDIVNEVADDK